MTIKIYRGYPDNEIYTGDNYILSIVLSDSDFTYVADKRSGFDNERKEMLVDILKYNKRSMPTDSASWVSVAIHNISGMSFVDVTGDEEISEELYQDVIDGEISIFEDLNPEEKDAVTAAVTECPPATKDIALNLKNRKNAIDVAMYGPLNPAEPNDEYWQAIAAEWNVDAETARKQRCGNCAVFVITTEMKNCISQGLTGETESNEFDAIDAAGELGYCEAFDFKCASARTCRAWVAGGPVDDDKAKEQ